MKNTYLFLGEHKYWLMTHWNELEPGVNYVLNRALLYRDRRDFVSPARRHGQAGGLSCKACLLKLKQ